jgi:hypothetical protein
MLKWDLEDPISVWGKSKCLHKKVGYLGCYVCPESGFVPMDHLKEAIKNKQDLLKDIIAKYVESEFFDMN